MIALPAGVKVWLAAGATDMRNGFDGLAALRADAARGGSVSPASFLCFVAKRVIG